MTNAQTHLEAALAILLRERDVLDDQLRSIRSVIGAPKPPPASPEATPPSDKPARKKRRKLSAEARERIAAAQKKRWEKFRSTKKPSAAKT